MPNVYRFKPRRYWRVPLAVVGMIGALAITQSGNAYSALIGRASVIDGDTIEIRKERVRFNGIDAPESRQICRDASGRGYRCGAMAANALASFLADSSPIRCEYVDRDRYGRFVGDCYRADGASVSAWLVRNGLALD